MLYVPNDLLNSAYYYTMSNYYYIVYTNKNCYNQYSNIYCDCINIYFNNDYLRSNAYSCNRTNISSNISYDQLSDNWVYRVDSWQVFLISFIIFCLIIFFVLKPIIRLFGRWLKYD